jgi:hypothetical protein
MGVRLVLLHPNLTHSNKAKNSDALTEAKQILDTKGSAPRYCKNLLIFLALDGSKQENLFQRINEYLAWNSIVEDKEILNLNPFQNKQALVKLKDADNTVKMLLQDSYQWLLVPDQPEPTGEVEWEEYRLQGKDSPILQASRKLVNEEHLITTYAAARLTLEILNDYVWKNANHIDLKTLWKYLTNYLYLPRLKDEQVLSDAIAEGVANLLWNENFAYANGYDQTKQKYLGLEVGKHITPIMSSSSLLVKPDVAQQQIQKEVVPPPPIINPDRNGSKDDDDEDKDKEEVTPPPPPQLKQKRRFYGSVELDSERINRDASAIADEVLQHLTSLIGSKVKVTLEIEAKVTEGIPDNVIRTVSENCKTLKFTSQGFEEE